jgi:energy-converting hydrogenase Eha subunit B
MLLSALIVAGVLAHLSMPVVLALIALGLTGGLRGGRRCGREHEHGKGDLHFLSPRKRNKPLAAS